MKKNIGAILKVAISIGLGIGLMIWFWNSMSDDEHQQTIAAFKRANYFWVVFGPLLGFAANFLRTQRWRLLLQPLGFTPSYWNTFHSVMTMYFFNLFVPRLGEVTRCSVLAKYEEVPVEKSLGTMVTERLVDVLCLGVVFLLVILLLGQENYIALKSNFNTLTKGIGNSSIANIIKLAIPIFLILGVLLFSIVYIKKHGYKQLENLIVSRVRSLLISIFSVKDVKERPQFVLLTIGIWLCYLLMFYVNYLSLPETKALPFSSALACLLFGSMAVILTPGGIGIFPIIIQMVLVSYNVAPSIALAIGMIAWTVQTLGILLGGMASLIFLNINNKKTTSLA